MAASSEKAPEPSTPRVITSDEGLTAWDIDPYKQYYPFPDSTLGLVCAVGLGYPLREDVPPEAVFTGPDHVMFAKACGQVGYDFEKIGKIMGRPQWCIAAYAEFCDYVAGTVFLHGHIEHFKRRGFTKREVEATVGLLYGLVLDGKWERRFAPLWKAMLEVEANGGVIPDHIRAMFQAAQERQARRDAEAAAAGGTATPARSSKGSGKGSRKKAAKRARKADARAATAGSHAGTGGQAPAARQSKFQGVLWHSQHSQWLARLMVKGRNVVPAEEQYHDDEEAAARAYDRAARKHLGANAITNYASEESTDFLDPKSKSGTWGGVDGDVFSDFYGVNWHKPSSRWRARISVGGKSVFVGSFDDPEEAAKAYDSAARKFHGAKAQCNFDAAGTRTTVKARVVNSGTKPRRAPPASTAAAPAPQSKTHPGPSSAVSAAAAAPSHEEDEWEPAASMHDKTAEEEDDDDWEAV